MNKYIKVKQPGLIETIFSSNTGEILSEKPLYKTKRVKYKFVMVFDLRELAKRLNGKSLEAFTIMMNEAGYTNTIDISSGLRRMLSAELNTSLQNVAKYIKEIKDKDIIRYSEYDKWMINPELVWKGSIEDRENALIDWQVLGNIKRPEESI